IKVRVVAKCDDDATAVRILDAEEKLIRELLGDAIFGIDDQSMETVVLDLLRRRGLTVAAAESITGGILSARMSAADPAMETFRGASIAPATAAAGGPPGKRAPPAAARVWRPAAHARRAAGVAVALAVLHPRGPRRRRPRCRRGLQDGKRLSRR